MKGNKEKADRQYRSDRPGHEGEEALLSDRARALSRLPEEKGDRTGVIRLVTVIAGEERFGVDINRVREVHPIGAYSKVPCTPDHVVGVVNIRGGIYAVVDIAPFLGLPFESPAKTAHVLLMQESGHSGGLEVCLLSQDLPQIVELPRTALLPPSLGNGPLQPYAAAVTEGMLTVLHIEGLLADPRMIVHEEINATLFDNA